MVTFAGQLLLGGRLEEGGWRGYLLPCLYKEYNILFSSVAVSAFWIHPARQLYGKGYGRERKGKERNVRKVIYKIFLSIISGEVYFR
ncbi:MAG: CPBP family intramembrane metalloprotease [Lachnospiraceae bacterium]|mgnify:CR=1 FL=1|jgi:hypothetical protein|nr:CPBP family intramembrane metalloprotease [Lachnospiraceae bacterium]